MKNMAIERQIVNMAIERQVANKALARLDMKMATKRQGKTDTV